jgi:anti-sigma factor RsiW
MTMFTRHVSRQLAAYIDGALAPRKAQQAELHMGRCAHCRAECEQVRFGMAIVEHLPSVEASEAIWASVEAAFYQNRSRKTSTGRQWRLAFAAIVVAAVVGAVYWRVAHQSGVWEVTRLDGSPAVGAKHIRVSGRITAGEWIETDSRSRATVKVGQIGSVEVTPNTRVRVVTARPGEHRLALAYGEIRARISAPPRLFFVDTASGTAVDLGCEYALYTGEDGFGWLRVTKGWVSFQWNGLESLVPAGASCRTRPHVGPGIPYFDDAPESVQRALESFGSEKAGTGALRIILSESRVRDTLTLWHLLSRVEAGDRERIYNRMAELTPVPSTVSREQALKLDPDTLRRWKEELAWTW